MIEINTRETEPEVAALWDQARALALQLPGGWVLVGGLMVQLHALEAGLNAIRATTDIDVLGRARHPKNLEELAATLERLDFKLGDPDQDGYSHRFEKGELVVDLLAPDGLRRRVPITKTLSTVGIPGGSQALSRAERVRVITTGGSCELARPSILGAVLIKARSLLVHRDPDTQL